MEYLIAFALVFGLSMPMVWIGDRTGNDRFNKIGFAILGAGILGIYIYASAMDGGRIDPTDLYRR